MMKHFRFEKAIGKYLNTKWLTNEGYEVEIIEYFNSSNCTIHFTNDNKVIKYGVTIQNLKNGNVKNPFHPSVYEVGFVGIGSHVPSIDRKDTKVYKNWTNILRRGYNLRLKEKYPTYKDCTVVEEWHNFQNFAKWFEETYNPETMEGWHLDKDILVKGNKVYSPETCCFVPQEINGLFVSCNSQRGGLPIGVSKRGNKYEVYVAKNGKNMYYGTHTTPEEAFYAYKTAKELWIKEVADKWREQITEEVYQAMYNYKVEIND